MPNRPERLCPQTLRWVAEILAQRADMEWNKARLRTGEGKSAPIDAIWMEDRALMLRGFARLFRDVATREERRG